MFSSIVFSSSNNSQEVMRIDQSGNVGVGATASTSGWIAIPQALTDSYGILPYRDDITEWLKSHVECTVVDNGCYFLTEREYVEFILRWQ